MERRNNELLNFEGYDSDDSERSSTDLPSWKPLNENGTVSKVGHEDFLCKDCRKDINRVHAQKNQLRQFSSYFNNNRGTYVIEHGDYNDPKIFLIFKNGGAREPTLHKKSIMPRLNFSDNIFMFQSTFENPKIKNKNF